MKSAQFAVSLFILFVLTLWLGLRVPAFYHQEQGARLLARALLAEGRGAEGGPWLEPKPLIRPEAQSLAAQALARFEAAVAADPDNFQAHRWLGRAALLLGRPEKAIAAFSAAARMRPNSPLVWWDLGLAYEWLSPASALPESGDMNAPAITPDSRPVIIDNTDTISVLIPAASVEIPSMRIADSAFYIHWQMPDAPDAWPGWWVPAEPVRRTVLLAAVPATVTFRLSLPITPTALLFWMGMDPLLRAPRGDGVVYRVRVESAEVFSHTLRPEAAQQGWWPVQVDLTPWAGQTICLTLSLDSGSVGDAMGDWAGWGDLQLVPAEAARCRMASCWERAAAAWREGGFTSQDFIQAGEVARQAKRYEEALRWYGRAAWLKSGMADPLYYIGLVFLEQQDWDQAYRILDKVLSANPGLAKAYIAQAWVLAFGYNDMEQARVVANQGIRFGSQDPVVLADAGRFYLSVGDYEIAERVLRNALVLSPGNLYILIDLGRSLFGQARFEEALKVFEEASRIQTGDWQEAIAHAWLGQTYMALQKPEDAVREFILAAQLHPADADNFVRLGDAYQLAGEQDKALDAYKQALAVDPKNDRALERIANLIGEE